MQTYEYVCDDCGHKFDELQSFSEEPLKQCPECHKNTLRRLFGSGAGFIFKGAGFYQTDYRSDSYKSAAQKESEAAKPAASDGKSSSTETSSSANASNGAKDNSAAKSEQKKFQVRDVSNR